jgi:hypothetical protein
MSMIEIEKINFNTLEKTLLCLNIFLAIFLIIIPLFLFFTQNVPVDFLFLSLFGIGNVIISLFAGFRFNLVLKYPYVINLPALSLLIGSPRLSSVKRGLYINKLFGVTLILGILLGIDLAFLEYIIIISILYNIPLDIWVILFLSLITPFPIIIFIIYLYNKVYLEIKKDLGIM